MGPRRVARRVAGAAARRMRRWAVLAPLHAPPARPRPALQQQRSDEDSDEEDDESDSGSSPSLDD